MDLGSLDTTAAAEQGAVMEVCHPVTGAVLVQEDGTPVTLTLAGMDSERFRAAQRAITNRRLAAPRRGPMTAEEIEAEGLDSLAACTLAWSGIVVDGKSLECAPAAAKAVYKRLRWLREQAERFVGDRANFLKDPPST